MTTSRVTCRWDDQPGVEPGWYCQSFDGESFADDSQKVWFPVRVDEFTRAEADELCAAIGEAFPGAEVEIAD